MAPAVLSFATLWLVTAGARATGPAALLLLPFILIAMIVVVIWATVRLGLAGPVVMLEPVGPIEAIRRSFELTRGFTMRNFGVVLVASLVVAAITVALSLPIGMLAGIFTVFNSQITVLTGLVTVVSEGLIGAIAAPFSAAITVLLYVDLRMRKEGLDVALARAADPRH